MSSFIWNDEINLSDANKWNLIKTYRNGYLLQCDWTQLADAVLTDSEKIAWATYRQALRDIPQDFTNPDDVEFPEVPA